MDSQDSLPAAHPDNNNHTTLHYSPQRHASTRLHLFYLSVELLWHLDLELPVVVISDQRDKQQDALCYRLDPRSASFTLQLTPLQAPTGRSTRKRQVDLKSVLMSLLTEIPVCG
jgi:hypothetical protein